jgi:hypothetical protein
VSNFRDQEFGARLQAMGQEAEDKFLEVQPKAIRLGWDRIHTAYMRNMTNELKHLPDHFDPDRGVLVECVGMGRDGVLKLRTSKLGALRKYHNSISPVALFVWNRAQKQWALLSFEALRKLADKARKGPGVQKFEVDGNLYYPIEWADVYAVALEVGS